LYDAVQNGAVKEGTMVWITGTTSEYRQLLQINQPSETVNDLAAFNIYMVSFLKDECQRTYLLCS
jgi:DNA/RNA endonuclease YhcR with UshA esterase domain